ADEALARDVSSGAFRREAAGAVSVLGKAVAVDEGLSLLAVFQGLDPGDVLDHLQTKYTRLFYDSYMPFVPAYESIYSHEQQMNGARAERAREIYRQGGFQPPTEEMVDHVSVELDGLAHLLRKQGSGEGAEGPASSLLFGHLVRWAGKFCADVEELSGSEFYRGTAMILRGVLSLEEKGREGGA
ncbi:MAG: molecular chaperone TorD family protein, partial [Nitrospirae bacterium]|nr:molecular chaperone TorD family protein [Nitrospirota bacterium]